MTKVHLSRTDEALIRHFHKSGLTYAEIADRYGISQPRVHYICNRAKSRETERICKCGALMTSSRSIVLGLCGACRRRLRSRRAKIIVPVIAENKPKTFREKVRSVLYKAVNVLLQLD